jgi:hypothetical protein
MSATKIFSEIVKTAFIYWGFGTKRLVKSLILSKSKLTNEIAVILPRNGGTDF